MSVQPAESRPPHHLSMSMRTVFSESPFVFLAISSAVGLLLLYLLLFLEAATFSVFFKSNIPFYNAAAIVLTALTAALGSAALTQSLYIISHNQAARSGQGLARELVGAGLGALSTGCPSCAVFLLPLLGIAGSLAAFPLGGLELKLMALIMLADATWEGSRIIAGVYPPLPPLAWMEEQDVIVTANRQTLRRFKPLLLILIAVLAVYLLPRLPTKYRVNFTTPDAPALAGRSGQPPAALDVETLLAEINPPDGYALPYTFGDIGPALIEAGAIDLAAFRQIYDQGGQPLTDAEVQILTSGSTQTITINQENAHFLLNLFWALGLANQNPILEEGPLMQNSGGKIDTYASTGGWTLASKPVTEVYSSTPIITLTPEQQARVEEAASNTYRPCCSNSTAFADCNHGMAMLGLFELMASQGATVDEMYEAAKYFNAFWFPQQALDLAVYFHATTGQSFADVDARIVVSAQYSSGRGANAIRQWLAQSGKGEQVPGGGSCGT